MLALLLSLLYSLPFSRFLISGICVCLITRRTHQGHKERERQRDRARYSLSHTKLTSNTCFHFLCLPFSYLIVLYHIRLLLVFFHLLRLETQLIVHLIIFPIDSWVSPSTPPFSFLLSLPFILFDSVFICNPRLCFLLMFMYLLQRDKNIQNPFMHFPSAG